MWKAIKYLHYKINRILLIKRSHFSLIIGVLNYSTRNLSTVCMWDTMYFSFCLPLSSFLQWSDYKEEHALLKFQQSMKDASNFLFSGTYSFASALICIIVNRVLLWTRTSPFISKISRQFSVLLLKPIKLVLYSLKSQQLYVNWKQLIRMLQENKGKQNPYYIFPAKWSRAFRHCYNRNK